MVGQPVGQVMVGKEGFAGLIEHKALYPICGGMGEKRITRSDAEDTRSLTEKSEENGQTDRNRVFWEKPGFSGAQTKNICVPPIRVYKKIVSLPFAVREVVAQRHYR
jgi:hypothetical protein